MFIWPNGFRMLPMVSVFMVLSALSMHSCKSRLGKNACRLIKELTRWLSVLSRVLNSSVLSPIPCIVLDSSAFIFSYNSSLLFLRFSSTFVCVSCCQMRTASSSDARPGQKASGHVA